MRILYCNKYNFRFSGTEAYLFDAMELMRSQGHEVALFAMSQPQRLAAISVAATLFGGLTYVGNSPNLLVRAIAQARDAPCPGFLSYIVKYAFPILLPVLGLTALVSFRH